MINTLQKVIEEIEKLPSGRQEELAKLIQDELSWDATLATTQEQLAILAKEASKEYKSGNTSEKPW